MGIKVKDTGGKDFEPLEAGTYAAVCTHIIGLGMQETPWGMKDKLMMRFDIPSERVEWETDGEKHNGPAIIWTTYTASLTKSSNLRIDLEQWRGREFTPEELAGFDLDNVLGAPCMITVVHKKSEKGKTFANISTISKLPKGMEKPKPENELIGFDPDNYTQKEFDALPEWLQTKITTGIANKAKQKAEGENPVDSQPDNFHDDDLPF